MSRKKKIEIISKKHEGEIVKMEEILLQEEHEDNCAVQPIVVIGKKYDPTEKQVQSFLGLTGYFRIFIAGHALIAKPLSDLLKKDAKYVFGEAQQLACNQLKNC
ncbi:hypothetical protein QE152_g25121 [Popillia japonica]|uniref:Uncharacterized protein n=1 Tax=Popillia japonica TaxID=7064 RepID=A0AAW1K2Z4_POPJA